VTQVRRLALTRQHQHFHARVGGEQIGDQRESLTRVVRFRGQSQIDQGDRRLWLQIVQHLAGLAAGLRQLHIEQRPQQKTHAVANERVVVDQQQSRFGVLRECPAFDHYASPPAALACLLCRESPPVRKRFYQPVWRIRQFRASCKELQVTTCGY
jgi:hypothetical protein